MQNAKKMQRNSSFENFLYVMQVEQEVKYECLLATKVKNSSDLGCAKVVAGNCS